MPCRYIAITCNRRASEFLGAVALFTSACLRFVSCLTGRSCLLPVRLRLRLRLSDICEWRTRQVIRSCHNSHVRLNERKAVEQHAREVIQDVVSVEGLDSLFDDCQAVLTVPEASARLGIPQSTLYRQIKAGRYVTVRGGDKKLRVRLKGILTNESHVSLTSVSDSHRENLDVSKLVEKLEAANYRIGYLESKVESQQEQLRLLNDTQKPVTMPVKVTWWQRFLRWFLGGG